MWVSPSPASSPALDCYSLQIVQHRRLMQSKRATILVLAIIIALAAMGLISCSPAKKMLKENSITDQLKDQYQAERERIAAAAVDLFVKNNPCPAMPPVNLDSLCRLYYNCPDVPYSTPAADYFSVEEPKVIYKTRNILQPYEDTRALSLLKDSIRAKDIRLASMAATIAASKATAAETIKDGLKTKNWLMWLFVVISIVEAAAIIVIARK